MPVEVHAMDPVPESSLKKVIMGFAQDGANIITAINEGKGNFLVEWTFIDEGPQQTITIKGRMSTFGGPHDLDVGEAEGLALYNAADVPDAPTGLFLDTQPPGTTGLARRLNPAFNYLACRWDYSLTPPEFLRKSVITVSANGKSVTARPADWGPNISTGRIADLSPGLAHALSLDTDKNCTVVIPLPDGTVIPVPEGAPIAGVDPITIDAMRFPADMTRTLVVWTTAANKAYWVVDVVGPDVGGQTLMLQVANDPPKALRSDTVVLPIRADDDVPAFVAAELNKAVEKEQQGPVAPGGDPPRADDDINAKIFTTARTFVGHVTSNVPGTHDGKLACAWAVNEVVRLALGKPISSDDGSNGLSTDGIFDVLNKHHTKLDASGDATPGTIVIAPTRGETHGHVGIVGSRGSSVDNTDVFSNKSVPGIFARNFTIGSFTSHYTGLGLEVFFFNLQADQFTAAPGA